MVQGLGSSSRNRKVAGLIPSSLGKTLHLPPTGDGQRDALLLDKILVSLNYMQTDFQRVCTVFLFVSQFLLDILSPRIQMKLP